MPIVKINAEFLKNGLTCPNGKNRIEYVPDNLPGMYLLVTAASPGQGTYFFRFKQPGTQKTCHIKIGRTSEISFSEASKQFSKLKGEISTGTNPYAEEKARKAVITVDSFFKDHYLPFVTARLRSWKRYEELYRLHISPQFGHLRLNQIDRRQVETHHASMLKRNLSPATADHFVKVFKAAMNIAVNWGMADSNPIKGVRLFNAFNQVERIPTEEQLQNLLSILQTHPNRTVCNIVLWLLCTGARLNEALQATFDQIDIANRIWRVPAANSKSKKARSIPLNDSAIYLLEQLNKDNKYLFINSKTGKPMTTIMKQWSIIRAKAKLENYRLHDARHTFASILVNSGRALYEAQLILGHSCPKVTSRYAHLSSKTLLEAANSVSILGNTQAAESKAA